MLGGIVKGLLGGGGSGALGSLGGVVGGIFGGPVGSMVGSAIGDMLSGSVGNATKGAAKQLHKEDGMPKFVLDLVNQKVDAAMKTLKSNTADAGTVEHCKEQHGDSFRKLTDELCKSIVDAVRNEMKKTAGTEGADDCKSSKGGKSSGGSWMQAIAKAMGEVMGNKAKRMVELSKEIADKSASGGANQSEGDKAQAAADTQKLNTEFQATGQEFNLLQTTFSTAIKTIGEGMASIARKQ